VKSARRTPAIMDRPLLMPFFSKAHRSLSPESRQTHRTTAGGPAVRRCGPPHYRTRHQAGIRIAITSSLPHLTGESRGIGRIVSRFRTDIEDIMQIVMSLVSPARPANFQQPPRDYRGVMIVGVQSGPHLTCTGSLIVRYQIRRH